MKRQFKEGIRKKERGGRDKWKGRGGEVGERWEGKFREEGGRVGKKGRGGPPRMFFPRTAPGRTDIRTDLLYQYRASVCSQGQNGVGSIALCIVL